MTYFTDLASTLARLNPAPLVSFARDCPGTLWVAGNGGSASVAQHWACDLQKAARRRVQALGANSAVLTAWANDTTYAGALAAEFAQLARHGDSLICISCSGMSPNITTLLRQAWLLRHPRAIVTGRGLVWPTPVDVVVNVPHEDYGILEDCFAAIGHYLTKELA